MTPDNLFDLVHKALADRSAGLSMAVNLVFGENTSEFGLLRIEKHGGLRRK
jgi:hypothetical protein